LIPDDNCNWNPKSAADLDNSSHGFGSKGYEKAAHVYCSAKPCASRILHFWDGRDIRLACLGPIVYKAGKSKSCAKSLQDRTAKRTIEAMATAHGFLTLPSKTYKLQYL
jgi:hypothetical protein